MSEKVKLSERTSRVGKSKFDASVNYRDLWDDDLTNRAPLLLHQDIPQRRVGLSGPHCGTWEWWEKAPCCVLHFKAIHRCFGALSLAEGRDQVMMELLPCC